MATADTISGAEMPPKLDKNSDTGRIIVVASETLLDMFEEWRAKRRPLPNKSEAGRYLLEKALRAESGDEYVRQWVQHNIHNDPFMGDDVEDRVRREMARCRLDAVKANVFVTHPAFDDDLLYDVILEGIERTHDPELGFKDRD